MNGMYKMRGAEINIVSETEKILSKIIEGTEYSVYDVEFVKEGPNRYLRVYIDKDGGVSIGDCEFISRKLEKTLDEKDFIQQAYILEVSSPGLTRQLKKEIDFINYAGRVVDVKLFKPSERGQKEYQGVLKHLTNGILTIILPDGNEIDFKLSETASVRLSFSDQTRL